jgi:hypothetical protein
VDERARAQLQELGAFVRGFAFYDYENEEGDRARTPLSSAPSDRVGSRAEIRDAFVWYDFDLGDKPRPSCAPAGRSSTGARARSSRAASTPSTRST